MMRNHLSCFVLLAGLASCAPQQPGRTPADASVNDLRQAAPKNPDKLGRWLLAELLAPGGDPKQALKARKALDASDRDGLLESLSRALDDTIHGRLAKASDEFLKAASHARLSNDPDADLFAWFAIEQGIALEGNTRGLFKRWKPWVEASISDPQHLGWRARDELVSWWTREAYGSAEQDIEQAAAGKSGCLTGVRLAGPFGVGAGADALRSFPAEDPGPWPLLWPKDEWSGRVPQLLESEQRGCTASAKEAAKSGVFYAEGAFELAAATQAILVANNALAVWVDGVLVFERDVRKWSAWTHVGAGVQLGAGEHRIVAKLTEPETALRLLQRDGRPLAVRALGSAPISTTFPAPRVAFEADSLRRYVHEHGVLAPDTPWTAYAAALLAHLDHESEASTLLIEPLVKDDTATGAALNAAALFAQVDPIHPPDQTEDRVRALHRRALARDERLWESDLNRVTSLMKSQGMVQGLRELRILAERYPEVPALLGALASTYGDLGWTPEYAATVKRRAELFPEDAEGLAAAAELLTDQGQATEALALYERIRALDPDSDVFVTLALGRHDYAAAKAELERLKVRRPRNKELARRLENLEKIAGKDFDVLKSLESAVKDAPKDGKLRLALADAAFAQGKANSLELALAEAVKDGAALGPLKGALDLVEGMTELERYRLDTKQIISAFEASGKHLPGTAARVLDYLAVWVHADGSSRMLEHEILRVQSEEAISRFAEQEFGDELVLKARVIKSDGRILEPELVQGKPTVTYPHLEVGDYIETERVFFKRSEAAGTTFEGPHWFFREKDVPYARSEFLVVIPRDRQLDIATTGGAPAPEIHEDGYFKVYKWRVDESPAAPVEPLSVPPQEYLPSVAVSWGVSLERRLRFLSNSTTDLTPVDPRIVRIATDILKTAPNASELDQAKALYRYALSEIEEGEETDGRRAVVGKHGNRWRAFVTLCRAAGIPVRWAVARSRLAPDPRGPADRAMQWSQTALRVGRGPYAWVDLNDKYAPFGYVPAGIRGVEAYLLGTHATERVRTPEDGTRDELAFTADFAVEASGAAHGLIEQRFNGRYGSVLRKGLSDIEERRLKDAIETKILASNLRGARLVDYELADRDDLDKPLAIRMTAEIPRFAVRQGKELRISPPFAPKLGQYASLPVRQTPILIATDQDLTVKMKIRLPPGARIEGVSPAVFEFAEYRVEVRDRIEEQVLVLDRTLRLPAGRVTVADYPNFVRFTRDADAALNREIVVTLE